MHGLPSRAPDLVGRLGSRACCRVPCTPLPLPQSVSCRKRKIAWERPAVYKCRCGLDFRQVTSEPADPDLVAINAIVFRAAKSTLAETAGGDVADYNFPPELLQLKFGLC